jgi:hypothetical protein
MQIHRTIHIEPSKPNLRFSHKSEVHLVIFFVRLEGVTLCPDYRTLLVWVARIRFDAATHPKPFNRGRKSERDEGLGLATSSRSRISATIGRLPKVGSDFLGSYEVNRWRGVKTW